MLSKKFSFSQVSNCLNSFELFFHLSEENKDLYWELILASLTLDLSLSLRL